MDSSWNFISESSDLELRVLKTALEESKQYFVSCGMKHIFDNAFNAEYVLESLFEKMNLATNVTYLDFLKQLLSTKEENSGIDVENRVIANLFYVYISTLDSEWRSKFMSTFEFLGGPEMTFKQEILRRLTSSDIFRSVAPYLLLTFYLKEGKEIVTDSRSLAISSLKSISTLAKWHASLFVPNVANVALELALYYKALKSLSSESDKFILPPPVAVAIIYLHTNCNSRINSEASAAEYVDCLIRFNKVFDTNNEAILSIMFSLIEDKLENDEYGLELCNLVCTTLKDKKLEIPKRIKNQLHNFRDYLIYSLMSRLNIITDDQKGKYDYFNTIYSDLEINALFYDYEFPYLSVSDNFYYYKKDYNYKKDYSSIYIVADFLYLASKGINPFLHIKDKFDEDEFYIICYDSKSRKIIEKPGVKYYDFTLKYNEFRSGLVNTPLSKLISDEDSISEFINMIFNGDISELEKISSLFKIKSSDKDSKVFSMISSFLDAIVLFRKRNAAISNMVHTLRHGFAPRIKDIKRYIIETTKGKKEKEELLNKVHYIGEGWGSLIELIDSSFSLREENLTNMLEQIKKEYKTDSFQIQFVSDEEYCVNVTDSFKHAVLFNILDNAKKHAFAANANKNKNIVKFEILPDQKKENEILLRISNNGIPFTGNTQNVFDFKIKYGETGNTGEGLYYAKQNLLLCNSDIKMCSYPEKEFCVVFEIKLNRVYHENGE